MRNRPVLFLTLLIALLPSCENKEAQTDEQTADVEEKYIVSPSLQLVIDSAKVKGAVLIYDQEQATYYSNDFEWANMGRLPASTFKIPNSLIGLETGVVENDSTLFKWKGEKRWLKIWEQDLIFRDAFHFSCVPCYQEVARSIGAERMNDYLEQFQYGNMKVDSSNIDLFWLQGESTISPMQQIDFLQRFYYSELPLSDRTEAIMKRLMVIEENDGYRISGKTGWSIRNGHNNGWFVGFVETQQRVYFFATNVEPEQQFDMSLFPVIRKAITYKALETIGLSLGNSRNSQTTPSSNLH